MRGAHVLGEPIEGMDAAYRHGQRLTVRTYPHILDYERAKAHAHAAYAAAPESERGFNEATFVLVYLQGWNDAEELLDQRTRRRRRRQWWRRRR